MRISVKYQVIYRHKDKYGISEMCRFFDVSRSGYYDYVKRMDIPAKDLPLAEKIKNSFNSFFHTAVHTLMKRDESFVFTATLEEFKEYIGLQFGYTDEELLQKFATALAKAPYATANENGTYTVCCAHGYGSLMYDLVKVDMDNDLHTFTYTIYSDSTHTLPCREISFTLKKNKDSDVMTLVEIQSTKLNDLVPEVLTV